MAKIQSTVLQRFLRTGYKKKITPAVEDVLRVKHPNNRQNNLSSRKLQLRPPRYLKCVARDGNFYRLPIPPRKKKIPNIPRLPIGNALKAPKPLKPLSPQTPSDGKNRVLTWLQANIPIVVLNFGSLCTLLAFTRSDILELRSLSVTGNLCFITYTLRQKIILWPNIFWSSLFATVNGYKIYKILEERTASVSMTKEEEKIYVDFFMSHGITPKQFEKIQQRAEIVKLEKGELLVRKGDRPDKVYLVIDGSTDAVVLGRRITAASTNLDTKGRQKQGGDSGAWAGEMSFLEQFWHKEQNLNEECSDDKSGHGDKKTILNPKVVPTGPHIKHINVFLYSIIAAEDCTILAWSHEDLEYLMKSSNDLRSALTRAMSSALVGKVVNFTISRSSQKSAPWSVWLKDWTFKDPATTTTVQIHDDNLKLSEDKNYSLS